jgi:hypothetical protein
VWFHRYENGRDIEGRFDYNSWQESDTGRKLVAKLDKDVVLAEGKPSHPTKLRTRIDDLTYDECRVQRIQNRPHIHGAHGQLA